MENDSELLSLEADDIKRRIFTIRGKQVMMDSALAEYFGTTTGNLNRAMKRNIKRFPDSFCFQLTKTDYYEILRCQTGILELEQGKYSKYFRSYTGKKRTGCFNGNEQILSAIQKDFGGEPSVSGQTDSSVSGEKKLTRKEIQEIRGRQFAE